MTQHVATFPPGVECLGMTVYDGKVIVALTNGVYKVEGDKLQLLFPATTVVREYCPVRNAVIVSLPDRRVSIECKDAEMLPKLKAEAERILRNA